MWEHVESREVWGGDGIAVHDVHYRSERYPWSSPLEGDIEGIVLMRRGLFHRRADGVEHLVDPNTGYFRRCGEEVSVANFTGLPEEFTVIAVDRALIETHLDADHLPLGPFAVTADVDLALRLFRRSLDAQRDDLDEKVMDLVGAAVAQRFGGTIPCSRANTSAGWRLLVANACELMHERGGQVSVPEIARAIGSSPFHLSRVFRAVTGTTMSDYRMRLRIRAVLDGLSEGDEQLAELACTAGFYDHSHMTRALVAQLGETPSMLRRLLRGPFDDDGAASAG